MKDRVTALIDLLKNGYPDEQDDAATDLFDLGDERAIEPLATFALDPSTDDVLAQTCAEAIAGIWIKLGCYDRKLVRKMENHLRREVLGTFRERKPEWYNELLAYLNSEEN